MNKHIIFFLFAFLYLPTLLFAQEVRERKANEKVVAAWLTTLHQLDWPSVTATSTYQETLQKKELIQILDQLKELHVNTVFLQTRLRGCVIYPSKIEPFAQELFIKNREPGYDPLSFAIEECHKRGMECHAWFVTYPIGNDRRMKQFEPNSQILKMKRFAIKHLYEWFLDPGMPEVNEYLQKLIREIVSSYDIDGIHFDHVRYPEQAESFDDSRSFRLYGKGKTRNAWREENISRFMESSYDLVKSIKPYVQVSSAPIGKYRSISYKKDEWTALESVFQNPKKWIQDEKQDMIVPMVYFSEADFYPHWDLWTKTCGERLLVAGIGIYKLEEKEGGWRQNVFEKQIQYVMNSKSDGVAFYRVKHLLSPFYSFGKKLKHSHLKQSYKLPPLSWLSDSIPPAPGQPEFDLKDNQLIIQWRSPKVSDELFYNVYITTEGAPITSETCPILIRHKGHRISIPLKLNHEEIVTVEVRAVSRYRIESQGAEATFYNLPYKIK